MSGAKMTFKIYIHLFKSLLDVVLLRDIFFFFNFAVTFAFSLFHGLSGRPLVFTHLITL